MSALEIRPAVEADDPAILELIRRTPQPGRVVLNFERDPAFHVGARVSCEQPDIWIARDADRDEVAAVFNIGRRTLYINGEPRQVRYAHDLRIAASYRGSLLLVRMFRRLRELLEQGEWMQTVILTENQASLSTVGSGRAGLPTYYEHGNITTALLFAGSRRTACDVEVRQANSEDFPRMQEFLDRHAPARQFFPVYRMQRVLQKDSYFAGVHPSDYWLAWRNGTLVGMAGLWDQKHFKQTRLLHYPGGLAWLRHLYNLWGALFGGVYLPSAGGVIDYRALHTVLIQDDDPTVLAAILTPVVARLRQQRVALVAAFFAEDPLLDAVRGFRRHLLYSRHFLVSFDGDPRHEFDERSPYVEVARL